jgi:hypothetical protein
VAEQEVAPPYRWAVAAALVVLLGYIATLAPTVTFWDAGELIAAAHTLGIPHPPGTPFYVLVAHVWGKLLPFGEYAWRLNLLSAICGAIAAGCWFLVAYTAVARGESTSQTLGPRSSVLGLGAGWSAALVTAFSYTMWQNAIETEIYAVAMVIIALAAWTVMRWRDSRLTGHGTRLLLVLLYLGGISIGNHLLALLVGPALVAMMISATWYTPLVDTAARHAERARIAVVATVWFLLIALGLGSGTLTLLGLVLVAMAAAWAIGRHQLGFVAMALLIVAIGVTPYLFLYLRAKQGPWINEADPSTWDALLAVIRRAQYPVRTPLDDPTIYHGPENPGRSLAILGYQLANYAQYFDWQWARSLGDIMFAPWRLAVTLIFASLGLRGAAAHRRADRTSFHFLAVLVLVTGLGLLIYMNFKPGPSLGWDRWPGQEQHEVRDRDYFFVASFVGWGIWVAIGIADLVRRTALRLPVPRRAWALGVFVLALFPAILNARSATRRQTAEATLARDFAHAMLQSVPPGGILFTWGDNDTFPLWYAQAVEGVRRDVTIVCLALAETQWYQRQLRDWRPDLPDREGLAAVWRDAPVPPLDQPLHTLSDSAIKTFTPFLIDSTLAIPLRNGLQVELPKGMAVYGKDFVLLQVLVTNAGIRPIAWSLTTAQKLFGLGPQLVQQGLVIVMPTVPVSGAVGADAAGAGGAPVDLAVTRRLIDETWEYGRLLDGGVERLDANIRAMANLWAVPVAQAGVASVMVGDTAAAIPLLERSLKMSPQPGVAGFLGQLKSGAFGGR